ncbi:hypothetical protein SAMN02745111_00181 [Eubacterium uniforme]|uniref:Uncharacterized protein n=1 Tax=Eubacterium uniforme TaxID=39495 RepID=A0A1T4V592_9FIRM|nr:hypothetical protein [Eubacterium uniforme]SKA60113.1 hypothetical protein SAMN02745111_00181 [Eubacterium uniforme]
MKLDKNQQKKLINAIYISSNGREYKTKKNTIYKVIDKAFIHCDFLIVNSQKLVYRIYIKNYDYDDIFWEIMQMSSNSKKNDSLRAIGAFKAPSVLLKKGEVELTEKYEEQAKYLVGLVDECSHNFMEKYDIDEYVTVYEDGMDKKVLKCLAYIHMNNIEQAIKIAVNSINDGNRGNYVNGGKAFFEWIQML